jgi:hypothetical protein
MVPGLYACKALKPMNPWEYWHQRFMPTGGLPKV